MLKYCEYCMMFENIVNNYRRLSSREQENFTLPINPEFSTLSTLRESRISLQRYPRFVRKRENVPHVGQEVVSVAVNEALIPSLLFPWHLFLVRCSRDAFFRHG